MNLLSKALMLAALPLTATIAIAPAGAQTPAAAPAAPPKLTLSDKARKPYADAIKELQKARAALGGATQITAATAGPVLAAAQAAEPHIVALEAAASTDDEQFIAAEVRYQKESIANAARFYNNRAQETQEAVRFAPYLDKLLANPVTPAENIGKYAFERGEIALTAQQYPQALQYFQRAVQAGNNSILARARVVDTKIKLRDYAGAATDAEPLIAAIKASGQKVPASYYLVAMEQAYRSNNRALSTKWEIEWLNGNPDPKNWHDALARLHTRTKPDLDLRQRLEVWRLMRATNALADEKERRLYGQDALDAAAFREAQTVMSEIPAADPATKALIAKATASASAATPPVKAYADGKAASTADATLRAGNINLSAGKYAEAAELFALAKTRGAPDADLVNMNLGIAHALAGNKTGAQTAFAAVNGSPRREIAAFWTAWVASRP